MLKVSRNMLPSGSINDSFDGLLTYSEQLSQLANPEPPLTSQVENIHHISVCKFGNTHFGTSPITFSFSGILDILVNVSKIQVIRIAARRIVAMVKHPLSSWYRTIFQFPSNSVCGGVFSSPRQKSIPIFLFVSRPYPAFIWLSGLNSFPKSTLRTFKEFLGLYFPHFSTPFWGCSTSFFECFHAKQYNNVVT